MSAMVLWLSELGMSDVARVGGKNASLGEMISHLSEAGVNVPDGFATTADAFVAFLQYEDLAARIQQRLQRLDTSDTRALTVAGAEIREWIMQAPLPPALADAITRSYHQLAEGSDDLPVAVRSSATAEDLPDASFAGQQETFLNISGLDNVLQSVRAVFASLYNDRAIAYRVSKNFRHEEVAISVAVQRMVRSGNGASGVMFTADTESGFEGVVLLTAAYGLGETIVQGAVNPDEFYLDKNCLNAGRPAILRRNLGSKAIKMIYARPGSGQAVETVEVDDKARGQFSLTDQEIEELARQALVIENHYGRPMDIEWAKDGEDQGLYIVQARPETVNSQRSNTTIERYLLQEQTEKLCEGRSVGHRIGQGKVRVVNSLDDMHAVEKGDVLVADMTDPDWEPVMTKAAAIVTNRGGRTCHAAIIARELGIPAVVGCGDATEKLQSVEAVTVSCAEGDTGHIYRGLLDFSVSTNDLRNMPTLPFKLMMNVGNPDRAFTFRALPNQGVGLARLEFIINRMIGIHPKAILNYASQADDLKKVIDSRMAGYSDPVSFFQAKIIEGVSMIASAFSGKKVIVRLSDFKSNEYAHLIGGELYEPNEENPMLGFRGASRYVSKDFQDCFRLECEAIRYVRDTMGFSNVEVMVPFCRTPGEASEVIELLAQNGLRRGENDLRIIMMCEIPANALLADQFLEYFDGFSIGSNDLTQLTLGLDRDSGLVAHLFDERNEAVKQLLAMAIKACKKANKYIGICGQGPSDHPDLALWLMKQGIDSISLSPDSILETWMYLANTVE